MRIGILGVGAIGGVISGYLARAGHDITLVDIWPENVDCINETGLKISSFEEEFVVNPRALHMGELSRIRPEFDIVILSLKSYDTAWASKFIEPHIAPGGFVVSAQNSINEDSIARVLGWSKVIGCVVTLGAGMYTPGHVERTSSIKKPAFTIGEPSGLISKRLEHLSEIMRAGGITKTTTNLWGERWAKLATNSMSNALAGLTGFKSAELRLNPEIRALSIEIAAELVNVGNALGVEVENIDMVPANLFPQALENNEIKKTIEELMIENAKTIGTGIPSLAQDLLKGKSTEIAYLNGYIVNKGKEVNIPTPVNQSIVELTLEIENGSIQPSIANVELVKKLSLNYSVNIQRI